MVYPSDYDAEASPPPAVGRLDAPAVPGALSEAVAGAYTRYVVPIYRFLYSRLGNQEEAEDLTSEVFLKAVRQLEPERDDASVQAWLYQVARTTLADYWRRRSRVPQDPLGYLDVPDPAGAAVRPDETATRMARWLLEQLPDRYREVLTLRFLRGYSIKETAQAMGITENHAKVLQYRAVQKAAAIGRENGRPPA
ncbi:MAG TPA: sigma-70 family RNA polymerase sigma factor [Chloroflexota bacterium]|nr:sigma-70 family RNA polymerase sigma factor [Chloroflexota bacterium]